MHLSASLNQRYASEVSAQADCYSEGWIHPHLIQSIANTALTNVYLMPTWMHVGTLTHHRAPLKEGDEIEIRTLPVEKWRKKGHEFIKVWVTLWCQDELVVDMLHTAIFKVAS